jgi:hypothetical protein
MRKIFISVFIVIYSLSVFSQQPQSEQEIDAEVSKEVRNLYIKPVYRAFSLHADIASPFMGIVNHRSVKTFEIQADVNLFDKIFPIMEAGFGKINATLPQRQSCNAAASFFRLGFNYNLAKNTTKEGTPKVIKSYPFIGLRYSFEWLNNNLENVTVESPYWDGNKILNFSNKGIYVGWAELVGGVRINLFSGLTMGWSVRFKTLLHSKLKNQLWYVPGHGFSGGSQFVFNYTIGYTFEAGNKKKLVKNEDKSKNTRLNN